MNKVAVIGSLDMNIVIEVEKLPKPDESVMAKSIDYRAGGKGISQAAAAAALGASTILIGTVGEDDFGQQLIGQINKIADLDSSRVINAPNQSTGITSILSTGSSSSCAYIPGANNLTNSKIAEENEFIFKEADVVLTQFSIPESGVKEALKAGKFGQTTTILNPVPYRKFSSDLLSAVSILTPNEAAFIDMAEDFDIEPGKIEKRILQWQKKYPDTRLIVTRGKDGLSYVEGENIVTLSPIEGEQVDCIGAGDVFNGALAALLSQEMPIEEAIYKSAVAAGLSVKHKGTLGAAPKMEDIDLYLSKSNESANISK